MKTKASEAARACLSRAATAGPFHCLQQVSYHMPSVDLPRQRTRLLRRQGWHGREPRTSARESSLCSQTPSQAERAGTNVRAERGGGRASHAKRAMDRWEREQHPSRWRQKRRLGKRGRESIAERR